MRVCFDTNVLVYAISPALEARHLAALGLLDRARHVDSLLLLQTMAELFAVGTRKLKLPADRIMDFIEALRGTFLVHAASASVFDEAVSAVREHRLSFWDAMIWAAAREAGCRLLLSEDLQDGRVLGGVRIVNPFAAKNAAIIDAALSRS